MAFDRAGLEILGAPQCLVLIGRVQVGRVAVTIDEGPVIFPVNFIVLDGSVVFRTDEGTKLDAAVRNVKVAFEADAVHSTFEIGWSVVILGTAEEVHDPAEVERAIQMRLRSWAPGIRSHVVRITATSVSGRRIVGDGVAPGP